MRSTVATTRHPLRELFGVALLLIALVGAYLPGIGAARASHATDNTEEFEIDGDAIHTGSNIDWDNVAGLSFIDDPDPDEIAADPTEEPNEDESFGPGAKESDSDTWAWQTGSIPPKDDITSAFAAGGIRPVNVGTEADPLWEDHFFVYVGFERWSGSSGGSAHLNFEFNQSTTTVLNAKGVEVPVRTDGDLLIVYDFKNNTGVTLEVREWSGGAIVGTWDVMIPPTAVGDANDDGPIDRPASLGTPGTITEDNFGEAAIDVTATIHAAGGTLGCLSLNQVWAKSRSSGESFDSKLKDVTDPVAIDLDTCGDITVKKTDPEGRALSGATFELRDDSGIAVPASEHGGDANPCTTTADGECFWDELEPGDYEVVETSTPTGYAQQAVITESLDSDCDPADHTTAGTDASATCSLDQFGHLSFEFANPRIPYQIEVRPDATNDAGDAHTFYVDLDWDPDLDGVWEPAPNDLTIDLEWDGSDPITGVNGGASATTCTTTSIDDGGGTETGRCVVTVNQSGPGDGTLTATFDTPYQHTTATEITPASTGLPASDVPSIADSATKTWVGYLVDVAPDGRNLLGDPHDFTVTVWETDGTTETLADGADVTVSWSGPAESTSDTSCTTDATGTCTITADSDTAVGTGTATVTGVSGTIDGVAVDTFEAESEGSDSADKTWVAYRVLLSPDADVNYVNWSHDFTAQVQYNDTDLDDPTAWTDVAQDGITVNATWDGTDSSLASDTCTTDTSGACTFTATATAVTSGTLTIGDPEDATIPALEGVWVDADLDGIEDSGELEDLLPADLIGGDTSLASEITDGLSATKDWVDYGLRITPDGINPLDADPDASAHTFTVEVTRLGAPSDLSDDDITVDLEWTGVGTIQSITSGTVDGDGLGGTCDAAEGEDEIFTCTVVVDSTVPGDGQLTASAVRDGSVVDDSTAVAITSWPCEGEGGSEAYCGDKTWVRHLVEVSEDATNYVGDDHTFRVTVYSDDGDGTPLDERAVVTGLDYTWVGPDGADENDTTLDCTIGNGQCTVSVDTSTIGVGTLVVTGATVTVDGDSYDVTLTDASAIVGTAADGSATKTWVDYLVEVDDDTNLVGQDHTFSVNVWVLDGLDGSGEPAASVEDDREPLDGATVSGTWSPPTGADESVSCVSDEGVCDITVTSPGSPGTGTLTIDSIDDPEVPRPGDLEVTTFASGSDDAGQKTWIAYRVLVTPESDVNVVNDGDGPNPPALSRHTFDVEVQIATTSTGGEPDWGTFAGTARLDTSWDGEPEESNDCESDFTGGLCSATVDSSTVGTFTFEVDELYAPIGGSELVAIGTQTDVDLTVTDVTDEATKQWIRYRITVEGDDVNLTGEPHTFWVRVEQQTAEEGPWSGVNGVEIDADYTFQGDAATPTSDTCATGTVSDPDGEHTGDGWCSVTVDSTTPGTGILSVDGATIDLDDDSLDVPVAFDEQSATKTWVAIDVDVSPSAVNLIDDPHDFDITVVVYDGSGDPDAAPLPTGSTVNYEWTGTGSDTSDCDDTPEGGCTVTVTSSTAGTGTLEIQSVEFDHTANGVTKSFTVDVTQSSDGQAASLFLVDDTEDEQTLPITRTKQWVSWTLTVAPDAVNLLPQGANPDDHGDRTDHTFTVTLGSSDATEAPVAGQTLSLTLSGTTGEIVDIENGTIGADGLSGSCVTDAAGTCDVTVRSVDPGEATLSASYVTAVGGVTIDSTTSGGDATKTWTTFRISVSPDQAQNLLGDAHELTVVIEQAIVDEEDGSVSYEPVVGAVPTLSVTAPAVILDDAEHPNSCATGTDATGTCTVWIDSAVTGPFTFTASYEGAVEQQTATFSDTAAKEWIDYLVEVTPPTAQNLVDTDHVFTVTISVDMGDGEDFVGVPGAIPALELLEGSVGTIESTTCTEGTASDGTCTVTITSSVPGGTSLEASYLGAAGGGDFDNEEYSKEYSDTGDKLWVDYALTITPESAINATNDPHVFTVTLTRDVGTGPLPASGETIDITKTGVGSITGVIDGTVDEGGDSASCTTGEDGTCDVVVDSAVPGVTTIAANYLAEVGETSETFSDEGVKNWAAIDLVKEADVEADDDGFKTVVFEPNDGDDETVDYTYTITNTGPVTLSNIVLVDDVLGTILDGSEGVTLAPGASTQVQATHTITQGDADAGDILNVAVVTGEASDGTEVTDTDDEQVFVLEVLPANPDIDLVKTALVERDDDGLKVVEYDAGDADGTSVTYEYLITNTGDVALRDITLVDDVLGDIVLPRTTLEPGESMTARATHLVTGADADRGDIVNVAVVTGLTDGGGVTATDDEQVFVIEVLDLAITGIDADVLALMALVTGVLGAALVLFGRRRRSTER